MNTCKCARATRFIAGCAVLDCENCGMRYVNGAPVPKRPDGTPEDVDLETFNMCGDCGDQVDEMGDAFGTHWASCEKCLNGDIENV